MEKTKERVTQKNKRDYENVKKENDNLTIRMNGIESELKVREGRREGKEGKEGKEGERGKEGDR